MAYPNLKIAGMVSPPFRPLCAEEESQLVEQINQSGAHIVLVALGCPKQEKWMAHHRGKINAVMVGIGWAFVVFAGVHQRAPRWMQDYSLEWLYRLLLEPTRLFKRYMTTNLLFLLLFLLQTLRHFGRKTPSQKLPNT